METTFSIIEQTAGWLMLAITIAVFVLLVLLGRWVKNVRKRQYPYVILYRSGRSSDIGVLGTYSIKGDAIKSLEKVVCHNCGMTSLDQMPDAVRGGFDEAHTSWKGKDVNEQRLHVWIATVQGYMDN